VKQATQDNLIVVGILMGIIAAACAVVYYPQNRKLKDLRTQIEQEERRLIETASKAGAVPGMLRQVQEMRNRYTNFDQRLPKKKELGGFLREISGNLGEESLANQTIEPGTPRRDNLFHTLPIVLRFEGPYLSLTSFLKRLGRMERLAQVEKLSISDKPSVKLDGVCRNLNVEVLMNIYFTES